MRKKIIIEGAVESLVLNDSKFEIVGDIEASDSYHSFDELYAHRIMLFLVLMNQNKSIAWKSRKNKEGDVWVGWFVGGLELPTGQVVYHIPEQFWDVLKGVEEKELSTWDGHVSNDVISRLKGFAVSL